MRIKKYSSIYLFLILLTVVFPLSGCSRESKKKILNDELERNRRLWQENKISDYNFVCSRTPFGMATWAVVLIKVRNGRAISIEPLGEPNPLAKFSTYESFDTVEKMFNEIQEAYDREFVVEVSYDKEYGYPEKMTLNNLAVFDGSIILDISKFEVVGQDIN